MAQAACQPRTGPRHVFRKLRAGGPGCLSAWDRTASRLPQAQGRWPRLLVSLGPGRVTRSASSGQARIRSPAGRGSRTPTPRVGNCGGESPDSMTRDSSPAAQNDIRGARLFASLDAPMSRRRMSLAHVDFGASGMSVPMRFFACGSERQSGADTIGGGGTRFFGCASPLLCQGRGCRWRTSALAPPGSRSA